MSRIVRYLDRPPRPVGVSTSSSAMAGTVTAGTGTGQLIPRINTQLMSRAIAAQPAGNDALARSVSVPDSRGGPPGQPDTRKAQTMATTLQQPPATAASDQVSQLTPSAAPSPRTPVSVMGPCRPAAVSVMGRDRGTAAPVTARRR